MNLGLHISDFTWEGGAPELRFKLSAARARTKTLKLVARYADACNISGCDVPEAARKLGVLREHRASEGRD